MTVLTVREPLQIERTLVAVLSLGALLIPLNTTMMAVALPQVMTDLGASTLATGWLITTYLITMACLQPVAGKLGDRWGRRRLILGGLAWFGCASLGAAVAPNMLVLLLCRMQQAIAGALALPNGVALVYEVIPAERRAGRFGVLGSAGAVGATLGPVISGLLIEAAGWRVIFYINVPLALVAVLLGRRSIPSRRTEAPHRPFDLLGALLLSAVLAGISGLLMRRQAATLLIWLAASAGLVAGALLFFWREWRYADPVLQLRLFRNRVFTAATSALALADLATYSTLLAVPVFLSQQASWTSGHIGMALIMLSGMTIVLAPFGGWLADRFGRRWPTIVGLLTLATGELTLALSHGHMRVSMLLIGLGIVGAGWGLAAPGLHAVAVEAVGADDTGVASGILSTCRFLGCITGSSILISLLGPARAGHTDFRAIFLMIVAAAFLAVLAGFGLHDQPPATPDEQPRVR